MYSTVHGHCALKKEKFRQSELYSSLLYEMTPMPLLPGEVGPQGQLTGMLKYASQECTVLDIVPFDDQLSCAAPCCIIL